MFDFDKSEKSTVNLQYIKFLHSYEWRNEKKKHVSSVQFKRNFFDVRVYTIIEKEKRSRVKLDKTSKFDCMSNNKRIVKISRFLE